MFPNKINFSPSVPPPEANLQSSPCWSSLKCLVARWGFFFITTYLPGYFICFFLGQEAFQKCEHVKFISNSKLTWLSESTHSSLRCRDHSEYKQGRFPEKFCEHPVDILKLHFYLKTIKKRKRNHSWKKKPTSDYLKLKNSDTAR